jgi:SHS2 domain-containing protein
MTFYERVEHTADLAIVVRGSALPELFANAARALFAMMTEPPAAMDRTREISLESIDMEGLLVDWLNELIYLHEVEEETYAEFRITSLTSTTLTAQAIGGATVRKMKTIKAATYHDLTITQTDQGVESHLVFDV